MSDEVKAPQPAETQAQAPRQQITLNPEHVMAPTQPIKLTNRLILSFYTAKRLMTALQFAVSRHESMFGPVEIDPQRRLRQMPPQQQRP
jgi:hypothetical protein